MQRIKISPCFSCAKEVFPGRISLRKKRKKFRGTIQSETIERCEIIILRSTLRAYSKNTREMRAVQGNDQTIQRYTFYRDDNDRIDYARAYTREITDSYTQRRARTRQSSARFKRSASGEAHRIKEDGKSVEERYEQSWAAAPCSRPLLIGLSRASNS